MYYLGTQVRIWTRHLSDGGTLLTLNSLNCNFSFLQNKDSNTTYLISQSQGLS